MDILVTVFGLLGPCDFNPGAFSFTEAVARDKKLWRDSRPMPTQLEMSAKWSEIQALNSSNKYKRDRKEEYEKQGLSFNSYVELLIENDTAGIATYKSKRDAIKTQFPKG